MNASPFDWRIRPHQLRRTQSCALRFTMAAILLALCPSNLSATDWYVDSNNPDCSFADGSSQNPFCFIGDALALAQDRDTIHIAPGLYFDNPTIDRDVTLIGTGGEQVTLVDGSRSLCAPKNPIFLHDRCKRSNRAVSVTVEKTD